MKSVRALAILVGLATLWCMPVSAAHGRGFVVGGNRGFNVLSCSNNASNGLNQQRWDPWVPFDSTNSIGVNALYVPGADPLRAQGCPSSGADSGAGGGIYATTEPYGICGGSCGDPAHTVTSQIAGGYTFTAPSGSDIQTWTALVGFRTTIEDPSAQTVPHWETYTVGYAQGGPPQGRVFAGCNGFNPVVLDSEIIGCNSWETSARSWAGTTMTGTGTNASAITVKIMCAHPNCNSKKGLNGNVQARINLRYSSVTLRVFVPPSVSVTGGSLVSGAWQRGTQTATVSESANTGIMNDAATAGGSNDYWNNDSICPKANQATESDSYYVSSPCATTVTQTFNVDTTQLADGKNRTVTFTAWDPAGNSGSTSASVNVDNSAPTPAAPLDCAAGLSVNAPADVGQNWLPKGTITVSGSACDTSGISAASIQVNGGSGWTSSGISGCGNSSLNAPGGADTVTCSFDTSTFPEGTGVQFRVAATNGTGLTGYSDPSSTTKYVDNTGPTVGAITFSLPSLSSPNGWTNSSSITAGWPAVSASPGSPITNVYYTYQPGPSGTGACVQGSTQTLAASAVSTVLADDPSVPCQQGMHRIRVWAKDLSGNVGPVRTGTYKYDSVVPTAPTGLVITPSGWSTTNNFTASYTNPTWDNVTSSPLAETRQKIGSQPYTTSASCLGSGASCTVNNITVPGVGGAYTYRVWLKDEAGNADIENAAMGVLHYNDSGSNCPR